ncbi:MAG: hypothetical protein FWC50_05710 [Planctomycetaceae bacterium]|nr:hypothetical protein [Planctomycetaceae bacterium]
MEIVKSKMEKNEKRITFLSAAGAHPELVWRCHFNQGATNGSGKTPDQFQICSEIPK